MSDTPISDKRWDIFVEGGHISVDAVFDEMRELERALTKSQQEAALLAQLRDDERVRVAEWQEHGLREGKWRKEAEEKVTKLLILIKEIENEVDAEEFKQNLRILKRETRSKIKILLG